MALTPTLMTELLILSQRLTQATLRNKLISASCTHDLILSGSIPTCNHTQVNIFIYLFFLLETTAAHRLH